MPVLKGTCNIMLQGYENSSTNINLGPWKDIGPEIILGEQKTKGGQTKLMENVPSYNKLGRWCQRYN